MSPNSGKSHSFPSVGSPGRKEGRLPSKSYHCRTPSFFVDRILRLAWGVEMYSLSFRLVEGTPDLTHVWGRLTPVKSFLSAVLPRWSEGRLSSCVSFVKRSGPWDRSDDRRTTGISTSHWINVEPRVKRFCSYYYFTWSLEKTLLIYLLVYTYVYLTLNLGTESGSFPIYPHSTIILEKVMTLINFFIFSTDPRYK